MLTESDTDTVAQVGSEIDEAAFLSVPTALLRCVEVSTDKAVNMYHVICMAHTINLSAQNFHLR